MDTSILAERLAPHVGKKPGVTIFTVSSALAHTQRFEAFLPPTPVVQQTSGYPRLNILPRGKRKGGLLEIDAETLILPGWDLPILPDSEGTVWSGNALLNLMPRLAPPGYTIDAAAVRAMIEQHNLNPFLSVGILLWWPDEAACQADKPTLLFPEEAANDARGHSVLERYVPADVQHRRHLRMRIERAGKAREAQILRDLANEAEAAGFGPVAEMARERAAEIEAAKSQEPHRQSEQYIEQHYLADPTSVG